MLTAWHFTNGTKLRDGRPLEVGRVYRHKGVVIPCRSGLHASTRLIDALKYAPGSILSRVEMHGELIKHGKPGDKIVGRERKVSWHIDATRTLWLFACWVAEDALKAERKAGREPHPASWAAPRARRAWLDGKITDAQLGEAYSEANSAAHSAFGLAFSAAYSAAFSAAYSAAYIAPPERAAHNSASGAADRTARSAAYSLADRAARSAAAHCASHSATYSATDRAAYIAQAYSAAYSAAYRVMHKAARERQNRKLTTMILQAHAKEIAAKCNHFHANGHWNDDGAWWCNACARFYAYKPGLVRAKMDEDRDDLADRQAITNFPEWE
jgi:hypothetical protein